MTAQPPSPVPDYASPHTDPPRETDLYAAIGLAIATLGLFIPLISLVAICLSIVGIRHTRNPFVRGRSIARAALMLGLLGTVTSLILPVSSYLRLQQFRAKIGCGSTMRQVGQAILQYSNDNRDHFPSSLDTLISSKLLDLSATVCPFTQLRYM